MDEESVLETEVQTVPETESTSPPAETEASETGDWTVAIETEPEETEVIQVSETGDSTVILDTEPIVTEAQETFSSVFLDDTIPETTEQNTFEIIETVGSDIVHADLFGSFLICGPLIGIAILRDINDT